MYKYIWPELKKDERLVEPREKLLELQRVRKILNTGVQLSTRDRFSFGVVIHKTIDTLIADMVKVLGIDEQTARNTVADLIRNKDKLTIAV